MAKPIKDTPVLKDQDAVDFIEANKELEKVSEKEKRELIETYEAFKEIAEFEL